MSLLPWSSGKRHDECAHEFDMLQMVEFLLHKGANCNATDRWGYTPLYDAVMNGSSGIVATMVQKGGESLMKLRDKITSFCIVHARLPLTA